MPNLQGSAQSVRKICDDGAPRMPILSSAGPNLTPGVLDASTKVEIPYFFYVVAHPEGNALFDTGGHPALIDDPRGRLGEAADAFEVTMEEGDDVVSQLDSAGFAPATI